MGSASSNEECPDQIEQRREAWYREKISEKLGSSGSSTRTALLFLLWQPTDDRSLFAVRSANAIGVGSPGLHRWLSHLHWHLDGQRHPMAAEP